MSSKTRSYPRHVKTDAGDIEFRLMSAADEPAVLDFAQKLPTHDLLFLPRNISEPKVLSAWVKEIARGAGLEKLSVQMTVDQQGAIALFESLGFKAEALLREHVRDVDGRKHDIVVLGHNVAQVRAQLEAYGLPGAVQH